MFYYGHLKNLLEHFMTGSDGLDLWSIWQGGCGFAAQNALETPINLESHG